MTATQRQVWLITGSNRGLGRALAERVLLQGDQLVATARDPSHLADLAERFPEQMRAVRLDVTDVAQADVAVRVARRTFGRIDVLVNNAGYGNLNSIEDTEVADFRSQIETNLFGVINLTKVVLPLMRAQRRGHIIQISSIGGRVGPPGRGAYAAAKWGVEGFSEVLATEVKPLGIKVTIVEPGGFRTDFAGSSTTIREGRDDYAASVGAAARFQRMYGGHQPGDPARAAAAIVYLAGLERPPLRLLLGSDAVQRSREADLVRLEGDLRWRWLSLSTDFDARVTRPGATSTRDHAS